MISTLLITGIKIYRFLFAGFVSPCRFWPGCSTYMIEAIQIHGPFKGLFQGSVRLLKCHPFHPGGVDLVRRAQP